MRLGRIIILIVVVLIIVIGVAIGYVLLSGGGGGGGQDADALATQAAIDSNTIDILMLNYPVARGQLITEDVIGFLPYRRDLAFEGMLTKDDLEEIAGERYAKYDLSQGMYLTEGMMATERIGSEVATEIEPGKVAISLPISRLTSVGYGLRAGDRVNIISTMLIVDLDAEFQTALPNYSAALMAPGSYIAASTNYPEAPLEGGVTETPGILEQVVGEGVPNLVAQTSSGGVFSPTGRVEGINGLQYSLYVVPSENRQRPRMVSQMLLQNVTVLHVGNFELEEAQKDTLGTQLEGQIQAESTTGTGEIQAIESNKPDIVTLAVTPQEAVTLTYLLYSEAELNITICSYKDRNAEPVFTDAVTLGYLMDVYNITQPAKLDYGITPRTNELTPPVLENDLRSATTTQ